MSALVLTPIKIAAAMVAACNVPEPDTGETPWNPATNYSIGTEAILTSTHRVYTALASGIDAGSPDVTPLRWKDTRPTRRYAAFDYYRSTAIRKNATLTMTVKPGIITAMDFRGLEGDSLHVVCKNATSLTAYHDQTYSLMDYLTGDLMWEFYFGTPRQKDALMIDGLYPQDAQVEITLTVSTTTGYAGIGTFSLGNWDDLGDAQIGMTWEPVDYSYIDVDKNGEVYIEKGLSAHNINGDCITTKEKAQAVADVATRVLGVPVAVQVTKENGFDYLSMFGLLVAKITPLEGDEVRVSLTGRGLI